MKHTAFKHIVILGIMVLAALGRIDANEPCQAVDRIARVHFAKIDRKIADLGAMRDELKRVIGSCQRDTVADCKIIETLGPRIAANIGIAA